MERELTDMFTGNVHSICRNSQPSHSPGIILWEATLNLKISLFLVWIISMRPQKQHLINISHETIKPSFIGIKHTGHSHSTEQLRPPFQWKRDGGRSPWKAETPPRTGNACEVEYKLKTRHPEEPAWEGLRTVQLLVMERDTCTTTINLSHPSQRPRVDTFCL